MRTTAFRTLGSCTVAAFGLLVVTQTALAQSGTRLTPDGKRALVSKDIAGQRWAISRNPDGTVTGNVFFPGGGAPQFVFCTQTSTSGSDVVLSCSGASACPLAECQSDEWAFVAEVTLPLAFFGAGAAGVASTSSSPTLPKPPFPGVKLTRIAGGSAVAASGLQLTPDRALTLISKDVGSERWAISRNDDATVTGNVFFPGGGEPQFVWCEPNGAAGADVPLRCLGAAACAPGADCGRADWTLIAEVALPASFFRARQTVALDDLATVVTTRFGGTVGFAAIALALDAGYSLRQVARAILGDLLSTSGQIATRAGVIVTPDGPRTGAFAAPTATADGSRPLVGPAITPGDLEDAFEFRRIGPNVIVLLLGLMEQGYSIEQIVGEIFVFDGTLKNDATLGIRLYDSTGELVVPANPPAGVAPPPSTLPNLCGNGRIDLGEGCDGSDLSFTSCEQLGLPPGVLSCRFDCSLDVSRCGLSSCGNGVVDAASEQCDGTSFDGKTCASLGLGTGALSCRSDCQLNVTDCKPSCALGGSPCCGPGTKRCGETCIADAADCCDGGVGYCNAGTVCVDGGCCPSAFPKSCGEQCIAAGASCCGNGVKEAGEECDGADLGGAACEAGGSVSCTGACQLDRSGCQLSCEPPRFECGSGCAPGGADCCGPQGYCDPGTVCSGPANDLCCPAAKPELCGGQCIPEDQICCGTYSCSAGDVCSGSAGAPKCCPGVYPVSCGSQCFAPGSVCCGDGACIPGAVCRDGLCGPP